MANDKDFLVNGPVSVGKDTKVTVGSITSSDIDLSTGNYFDDTLAANTTYTLSNAGDVQAFQLEVTGGVIGYNLASANYDGVSFSISGQEGGVTGLAFSVTGNKMFIIGQHTDAVHQYSLSTAFDLSTASYDSVTLSVSSQDTTPWDVKFNNTGTKMYVVGSTNDSIYQYSLSTAFDLSTASYDSVSFSVSSQTGNPVAVAFNNDGTKMYISDLGPHRILQYSLSTGFDISTASYDSVFLSIVSQSNNPRNLAFNPKGTELYVVGLDQDTVFQYELSTAFDLSTASYNNVSFNTSSESTYPLGLAFSTDGAKMYVAGSNSDSVHQYSTGIAATLTWPSSIEWAGGVAPAAPANGETDVFTFTTDDGGTTYTGVKSIDNAS
jgi:6-phosphogluconolactonase (cycloisomerase 2 family)